MKQYWAAKLRHPEAILLFRMGDFYEVFFDDAVEAAPIMGVTLTSRPMREGRQPMCGVPHHSWQGYVGKLLRAGKKVVICDQVEEPAVKGRSGVVRREITRVLTPGTIVDDAYLEPGLSNWLVAAWSRGGESGLAACDVSTGELMLCQLPLDRLQSEIDRLAPAELLQPPAISGESALRFWWKNLIAVQFAAWRRTIQEGKAPPPASLRIEPIGVDGGRLQQLSRRQAIDLGL